MPTLISETDVCLDRSDMDRRVLLPRSVGQDGFITIPPRARGLHLSGLLKYVAHASKITARLAEIDSETMPLHWALGQAWEEFAASLYGQMVWQPGEIDRPVIMNCDGLSYLIEGSDDFTIEEFKFNRSKKFTGQDLIQKKWLWMQQGLGYCVGYTASFVRWHVLSCMEWPFPKYTQYLIQFSESEVEGSRRMIEVNKDAAIRAGYAE